VASDERLKNGTWLGSGWVGSPGPRGLEVCTEFSIIFTEKTVLPSEHDLLPARFFMLWEQEWRFILNYVLDYRFSCSHSMKNLAGSNSAIRSGIFFSVRSGKKVFWSKLGKWGVFNHFLSLWKIIGKCNSTARTKIEVSQESGSFQVWFYFRNSRNSPHQNPN
jgi:hypothetical protein